MLNFTVDLEKCIGCGLCANDCPAMIIVMENNLPTIPVENEEFCIKCMHCVAVCSEGAASIHGYGPEEGADLSKVGLPTAEQVATLIQSRRSIRSYQDRNLDREVIDKLLEVASHAPTGHNDRKLLFTVVDDKGTVFDLREEAFAGLSALIEKGKLPEGMEMFEDVMIAWQEGGKDILFRGAPHLLIVSAEKESAAPLYDSLIALTTFELYAHSCGVGTIWNGLAMLTIAELVPSLRKRLGIPENHRIGYVMGFGLPALKYKRAIKRECHRVNRVR